MEEQPAGNICDVLLKECTYVVMVYVGEASRTWIVPVVGKARAPKARAKVKGNCVLDLIMKPL